MDYRILAIGVSGLPKQIKTVSWEEIKKGTSVNISDYDVVFIDFNYFSKNKDDEFLVNQCLNETKFFEVMTSGIYLYILGISGSSLIADSSKRGTSKKYIYSWLPDIIKITPQSENGEVTNCLEKKFSGYFNLLKKWNCYFDLEQSLTKSQPYLYDIKEIVLNNAGKKIGFLLNNFKKINLDYYPNYSESYYTREKYSGSLCVLHSLGDNSANGVLSIMEIIHNFSFSREKPSWIKTIQTNKSAEINKEIEQLFEQKQKIESQISEKVRDIENIEYFKELLWEVGHKLEEVVHDALRLMELLPSSPTKADDDGIINYKKSTYLLEIKSGLERAAEWTELSKLITRMNNWNKLNKNECQGLFIMNHFANHSPEDRDKAFPSNVEKTAKVNSVILVDTVELFDLVKRLLDGEIKSTDAQKRFFSL